MNIWNADIIDVGLNKLIHILFLLFLDEPQVSLLTTNVQLYKYQ